MIMFGIGGKGCLGPHRFGEGICVNKQEVEPQLRGNKTVYYKFHENPIKNRKGFKKIKRCDAGSDSECDFKEEMKDLKQDMAIMKRELIKSIRDQSKNCRPHRYGKTVGQKRNNYYNSIASQHLQKQ